MALLATSHLKGIEEIKLEYCIQYVHDVLRILNEGEPTTHTAPSSAGPTNEGGCRGRGTQAEVAGHRRVRSPCAPLQGQHLPGRPAWRPSIQRGAPWLAVSVVGGLGNQWLPARHVNPPPGRRPGPRVNPPSAITAP